MIKISVAKTGAATLRIYNILGQEVKTLFSGNVQPGKLRNAPLNAGELSSGGNLNVLWAADKDR